MENLSTKRHVWKKTQKNDIEYLRLIDEEITKLKRNIAIFTEDNLKLQRELTQL